MIRMPECGSLERFYSCVKEHMKKYRDSCDVKKNQKAHYTALRKCTNNVKRYESYII